MSTRRLGLLCVLACLVPACSPAADIATNAGDSGTTRTSACRGGAVLPCACDDGASGSALCSADGTRVGDCSCEGQARDGGTDTSAPDASRKDGSPRLDASGDAPLCRTHPLDLALHQDLRALALDSSNVYWLNVGYGDAGTTSTMDVLSVPRSGGAVTPLSTNIVFGSGLVADSTALYWESGAYWATGGATSGLVVERLPKGATTPIPLATDMAPIVAGSQGLTEDAEYVYWISGGAAIMRVAKAGGSPSVVVSGLSNRPAFLGLQGNSLYWVELGSYGDTLPGDGAIASAPKAGGVATHLATGLVAPGRLVVDDTSAFFVAGRVPGSAVYDVLAVPLEGGTVEVLLPDTDPDLVTTAIDTSNVILNSGDLILALPKSGGAPTVLASAQPTETIAADDKGVFWAAFVPMSASVVQSIRTVCFP